MYIYVLCTCYNTTRKCICRGVFYLWITWYQSLFSALKNSGLFVGVSEGENHVLHFRRISGRHRQPREERTVPASQYEKTDHQTSRAWGSRAAGIFWLQVHAPARVSAWGHVGHRTEVGSTAFNSSETLLCVSILGWTYNYTRLGSLVTEPNFVIFLCQFCWISEFGIFLCFVEILGYFLISLRGLN